MRHSRWDVKGEQQDGPKEQSRRWSNNSSQMDWGMRSDAHHHQNSSPPRHRPALLGDAPRIRRTPSPIDYRSESRRQHDNQQNESVSQNAGGAPHSSQQSSMGPPSSHYAGSWPLLAHPSIYTESDQGHHHPLTQYPARLWGQNHPTYYPGDTGQYIFDLKWWAQQKQSMDAYLGGPCWRNDNKNTHQSSAYPQWSFGTRVLKNYPKRQNNNNNNNNNNNSSSSSSRSWSRGHPQEGSYSGQRHDSIYDHTDPRRRQSSSSSHRGHKPREGVYEDHEEVDSHRRQPSLSNHGHKSRDSSQELPRRTGGADYRDMRKVYPSQPQSMRESWGTSESSVGKSKSGRVSKKGKQKQSLSRLEIGVSSGLKGSDSSRFSRPLSSGHGKMKPFTGTGSFPMMVQSRFDIAGKSKSKIKKKKTKTDESATYAETAKKKALAAAANKLRKTFLAAKKKKGVGESSSLDDDDEDSSEMTEENNAQDLSMPRRHPSCLEFDIDIRFSAKEWASVGRGQGGTNNILGVPQPSLPSKKNGNSSEKNAGLMEAGGLSCEEELEDCGTYSDSDLGKTGHHWSSAVTRRRHLSESSGVMDLRKNPSGAAFGPRPGPGRVRSCSLSIVEGAGSSRDEHGYTSSSRAARMKFHFMPKLKRIMLKQLLTMDKKSLQELVDDPRSRKAQFMMTHLMSEHRAALSQRLSQQRFKTLEALPDDELQLLNSLESSHLNSVPSDVVQQVREILALEQSGDGGTWEEVSLSVNDLLNADSDQDMDCQIISPPPRDPASTITIHDSDSEMEDVLQNDEDREHDDEEEEEEEEGEEEDEDEDEDDEVEDEDVGEEEVPQVPDDDDHVDSPSAVAVAEEEDIAKLEAASTTPEVKPSEAPMEIMPPVPVEVPMCVMEPISAVPNSSREIPDQVPEKINLMSPTSSAVNPQRPPVPEVPVPGPSSILISSGGLKVKEERPSPVSECGLCMHTPRTPHTSECLYPYGVAPPSPVALMPGSPRPIGTTPPQRPVPHLPTSGPQPPPVPLTSSLYQRSIKQEKLDDSFLKFEHVKRPSSEERPKNPAPPDTARDDLLPLPIPPPPPAQALHPQPHPRPLIFSPDEDFPGPPRPPPPPPPQFSPRIKLERHTPVQFMCCCMRNECERNSTHSAEMRPLSRRSVATPQPSERRPTPHLYKMEPPSPCASRARTPHQSLPAVFPPPASPRCINTLHMTGGTKVTVGVQTERERHVSVTCDPSCSNNYSGSNNNNNNNNNRRQYVPNLNLARSVTPLVSTKVDQSTTTEDLAGTSDQQQQQQQRGKGRGKGWWWHRNGRPRNYLSQLTSISNSISDFEFSQNSGVALQQIMVFSEQESEFVRHIENLDQDIHELLREKKRMMEELGRLQNMRMAKLQQLTKLCGARGASVGGKVNEHGSKSQSNSESKTPRAYQQDSSSDGGEAMETGESSTAAFCMESCTRNNVLLPKDDVCVQSTTDNASVVSSSQEKGPRIRSFSFSHTSSNDSSNESQTVRRQRCTSTCHSPGKSTRGKDSPQATYLGPFDGSEEFYQQIPSTSHTGQQSASNTDSETDHDVKPADIPGRSSEAVALFDENVIQSSSTRNRSHSLSSSAEGDIESEVPGEHDDEDAQKVRITKLQHRRLSNENGENVVDSSEQQEEKVSTECSEKTLKSVAALCSEKVTGHTRDNIPENNSSGHVRPLPCDESDGVPKKIKEEQKEEEEMQHSTQDSNSAQCVDVPAKGKPLHILNYSLSNNEDIKKEEVLKKEEEATSSPKLKSSDVEEVVVKEEILRISRKRSSATSPSSSPDSQKCRNSSGEHCYSLRSRGPPTDAVDNALLNADMACEVPDDSTSRIPRPIANDNKSEKTGEEEHADDEREKEDDFQASNDTDADDISDDRKRKRKRKTKKQRVNKKRKKKKIPENSDSKSVISAAAAAISHRKINSCPSSSTSKDSSSVSSSLELHKDGVSSKFQEEISSREEKDMEMESSGDEHVFISPPPHGCAVLDIKVVGDTVLTASSDGTARCYDLTTGRVMATYVDHTDVVTSVSVIGKPSFSQDAPEFLIITGSADKTICVFNGKSGVVKHRRVVGEGVRCLDVAWGQVFIGTEGGCGGRWNLKDKKVSEMVQYCGKALTNLKAMTEGGRRVLLVAAKTTPLMVRDAMSGLFLRTLEHIQLTVYTTVSHGGILYTGGSNKSIVYYDFTSGNSRGHIGCEADVSCLAIFSGFLIATCYDGLIRIFSLNTGELLQRIPVETTNKMFICSALYKDRLLIGNKKGEVIGCQIPHITKQISR